MSFNKAKEKAVKMLSSDEFKDRVIDEDESMLGHINNLIKINKKGFITTESQGGKKSTGKTQEGKHYTIQERAFVSGFMLEKKAEDFIKIINTETDKNAMFIPHCEDKVYLPSGLDIPLTITNVAGTSSRGYRRQSLLSGNKNEITTHTSNVLPKTIWEMYRKQAGINKTEKIVYVFCWDTKWNRNASKKNGLFIDIIKHL
jgi:hypothetical protein